MPKLPKILAMLFGGWGQKKQAIFRDISEGGGKKSKHFFVIFRRVGGKKKQGFFRDDFSATTADPASSEQRCGSSLW
jgi:hypothetical protein